jgi:adenosylmethionine-8-amino-7-oxononanoate aminotransferase
MDNHWLPFTPNRHFKKDPRVFVAADGMHFTTHDGKQVIDGISSLWCVGAGHNRKPINEAIKKQLDTLDYATAFQASNDQAFKAAEMIAAMAPGDLNKVLFCNSGSEAADTSLKVALAYHRARGEGHRNIFIGREKGYHGVGFGGMSVGGIPANRKVFGTSLLPRVDHMRFIHDPVNHAYIHHQEPVWQEDILLELENRILPLHDPSNVAAIIVEPVAGSAGWYLPPQGYLKRLREICDKHGILLIFDEVITGFGRLGTNFGADFYGVVPDMLNFAKAVTNGVIPLGGVICRDKLYDAMMKTGRPSTRSSSSTATPIRATRWPAQRRLPRSTCSSRTTCLSARARWARCWAMRSTAPSRACPMWWASAAWGWPQRWSWRRCRGCRASGPTKSSWSALPMARWCARRAMCWCWHRPSSWRSEHIDRLVNTLADAIRKHA